MDKRVKAARKRGEEMPDCMKGYTVADLVRCPRKLCRIYVLKHLMEQHFEIFHNRVNYELEENQRLKLGVDTSGKPESKAKRTKRFGCVNMTNMYGSPIARLKLCEVEQRKEKRRKAQMKKKKEKLAKEKLKKDKAIKKTTV